MNITQKSIVGLLLLVNAVMILSGCTSAPPPSTPLPPVQRSPSVSNTPNPFTKHPVSPAPPVPSNSAAPNKNRTAPILPEQTRPTWIASSWNDLPGWNEESMPEVWDTLVHSCERPTTIFVRLCAQLRPLSLAEEGEQRLFLMTNLQPFKIVSASGETSGLLTGYFEPIFNASRSKKPGFETPLYAPTAEILSLKSNHSKWYSRQEIEIAPAVQEVLRGQEIAWMSDPLDVLILQIQGSGRLNITENDGSQKWIKVIYAASNELPYQSIGRYLLDHSEITDASWPGIKSWALKNPDKIKTLLWTNPRYVFFKEEPLESMSLGPKGAQGLELTAGRSVAVDPQYINYGTPLWMVSEGPTLQLRRWVMAQDTGNAITGPLRADYFVGTGLQAGDLAGHLRQPLNLWALLPRQ